MHYQVCPSCGYQRQSPDTAPESVCPRCGLVFEKWLRRRLAVEDEALPVTVDERLAERWVWLRARLFAVPEPFEAVSFYGRLAAYLLFFIWGWHFIWLDMTSNAIGNSFMHNIDLVFHEAGHVLFRPFGWFMTVLGGSLLQLIVPLVVMGAFLFKEGNAFGASIGLWWLAQSMMDLAPYINDARAQQLMLLGGGTGADMPGMHDWNNLLGYLDLLAQDHSIAVFTDTLGEGLMLVALLWGGYLLQLMYRQRDVGS